MNFLLSANSLFSAIRDFARRIAARLKACNRFPPPVCGWHGTPMPGARHRSPKQYGPPVSAPDKDPARIPRSKYRRLGCGRWIIFDGCCIKFISFIEYLFEPRLQKRETISIHARSQLFVGECALTSTKPLVKADFVPNCRGRSLNHHR